MSFSATDAAFEGFRLVRRRPTVVLWWSLAYFLMLAVPLAISAPALSSLMGAAADLESRSSPTWQDIQPLMSLYGVVFGAFLIPATVVGTMLNAAVSRAVLQPEKFAFGYMRLGMDEVRVFVVMLLLGLAMCALSIVLWIVAGILAALAINGSGFLWVAFALVVIAILVLLVFVSVRLSLAIPITLAERRIAPFASWGVTAGRFWPMLGLAVLAFVLCMVVSLLSSIVSMPIMMATGGGLAQLSQLEGESLQAILAAAWPGLLAWVLVNAIFSALQLAVLYAPFAAAYAQIKGATSTEA